MRPAGYLLKRVEVKPDWLKSDVVEDIYSLSNCISKDFADYIDYWKHNGYWLFDSPEIIYSVAEKYSIDVSQTKLFYYEVYEYQSYENKPVWETFSPEKSIKTSVVTPQAKRLEGFDVVSVWAGNAPECSYLSCNHVAEHLEVNAHCLFSTFDEAKSAIDEVKFEGCEPGPCRIYAVYSVL